MLCRGDMRVAAGPRLDAGQEVIVGSRRRVVAAEAEVSALRRARMARNWTLEDLVEEMDLRTAGGHSGVTPSMVSGWELGRHTTSVGHRKTLCEIYGQSRRHLCICGGTYDLRDIWWPYS